MITPNGRFLGAIRDKPDARDKRYLIAHPDESETPLPPSIDLRELLPPVLDQGELGSCGPQSGAALMSFFYPEAPPFSRLQIYYDVRLLEGTVEEDAGVETRDVLRVLKTFGAAPESEWPYDVASFAKSFPAQVGINAEGHKIASYSRLSTENEFLRCLASGFPFILGFSCPDYIDSDELTRGGVFWLPDDNPKFVGAHDVLIVGYDLAFKSNADLDASGVAADKVDDIALLVRNSWGEHWGLPSKPGHFWLPMNWASNASTGGDAWTGRLTASKSAARVPTVDGIPVLGEFLSKKGVAMPTEPALVAAEMAAAMLALNAAIEQYVPRWERSFITDNIKQNLIASIVGAVDDVRNNIQQGEI